MIEKTYVMNYLNDDVFESFMGSSDLLKKEEIVAHLKHRASLFLGYREENICPVQLIDYESDIRIWFLDQTWDVEMEKTYG